MIDTHAHLMFPEFQGDFDAVILRAKGAGLTKILNVGCGEESSRQSVEMADGEFLYATIGLHPYDALDYTEELFKEWEKLIRKDQREFETMRRKRIVSIGETGLDYLKSKVDPEKQKFSFAKHLELAKKMKLPVIVHNRESDEDCFNLLREFPDVQAVFHCFGSNLEFARKVWEAGYFTSFTGIITYPNAHDLREVVKAAPIEKVMIETDCPYLAPQAYRGNRNEPAYVVEVAKCVAEVKNMKFEELVEILDQNTQKFFNI